MAQQAGDAAGSVRATVELPKEDGIDFGSREVENLRKIKTGAFSNLRELANLLWNGLPPEDFEGRNVAWKILLRMMPLELSQREAVLEKKRNLYWQAASACFPAENENENENEAEKYDKTEEEECRGVKNGSENEVSEKNEVGGTSSLGERTQIPSASERLMSGSLGVVIDAVQMRQIQTDLVRTRPEEFSPIFSDKRVQTALTRLLYTHAMNNPGIGYVQGINDLLVPFFIIFLLAQDTIDSETLLRQLGAREDYEQTERTRQRFRAKRAVSGQVDHEPSPKEPKNEQGDRSTDVSVFDVRDKAGFANYVRNAISDKAIAKAEAESYIALTLLVSSLLDNFLPDQPGIQMQTAALERYLRRLKPVLYDHLKRIGVCIEQVAFRWINCLLSRELSVQAHIRLFDTLIAEGLHEVFALLPFICVAMLETFESCLLRLDFQETMLFLQNIPSKLWKPHELSAVLSKA